MRRCGSSSRSTCPRRRATALAAFRRPRPIPPSGGRSPARRCTSRSPSSAIARRPTSPRSRTSCGARRCTRPAARSAPALAAPAAPRARPHRARSTIRTARCGRCRRGQRRARGAAASTRRRRAPFRPHATVARLRPERRRRAASSRQPLEPLEFAARRVTLYRLALRRAGARYEPLAELPLAALSGRYASPRMLVVIGRRAALGALLALIALLALPHAAQRALRWGRCGDFGASVHAAARSRSTARARCRARSAAGRAAPARRRGADADVPLRRPGRRRRERDARGVTCELEPSCSTATGVFGYDQRGTGRSGPAALPGAGARPAPALDAGRRGRARSGSARERRHYTTRDSVEDMEAIRAGAAASTS